MTRPKRGKVAGMTAGAWGLLAALAGTPATAQAQAAGSTPVGAPGSAETPSAPAEPGAPPAPPVTTPLARVVPAQADPEPVRDRRDSEPEADLDVQARPFAIGYAGLSEVPFAPAAVGGTASNLTVPALGLRYWFNPRVGLDLALGVAWSGGSSDQLGTSMDKSSTYGFLLHGGVPFALSTHRHTSFQVVPYASFARGWTSLSNQSQVVLAPTKVDVSGTRVDLGVRAGFEVFLGFIGIPELALSATVGLQFEWRKYSSDDGTQKQTDTTFGITTTVQNNPWDIFAGNVAARYYF